MSTISDALTIVREQRRALEQRIDPECFDVALSRQLDALLIAIEALEPLEFEGVETAA
jgi:hypothetical protein